MELKDAYKKAFEEQIVALVKKGKIEVLGTLEDTIQDIMEASLVALDKGAEYSDTKVDDAFMPVILPMIKAAKEKYVDPVVDKIDGEVG